MAPPPADTGASARGVRREEWRLLAILGLPTFAFALATTVVTTYLPVLVSSFIDSSTVIGLLIAVEGVAALLLAVPAGAWSDRLRARRPFVRLGTPVLVGAMAVMGFSGSLALALGATVVFYAAYYVAYEPYRALYPDLMDEEVTGRAQSTQALWRGAGTLAAIGLGGVLFEAADWIPFTGGAAVTGLAVIVFLSLLLRAAEAAGVHEPEREGSFEAAADGPVAQARRLSDLLRESAEIRAFLIANGLWELSLGALKTFILLYLTKGLGLGVSTASAAVAAVAVFIAASAPVSGRLADRFGTARVLQVALTLYGIGLLVPLATDSKVVIGIVAPVIGFGGGVVMTLPYALLIPLMPKEDHGLTTGLYSLSRGVGTSLGPLLAGITIGIFAGTFPGTEGYQAMWGICAAAILLSLPFLARLRRAAAAGT